MAAFVAGGGFFLAFLLPVDLMYSIRLQELVLGSDQAPGKWASMGL